MVRNLNTRHNNWPNGPFSYVIQVKGEQVWKRYTEHLQEVGDRPVEEQPETRIDDRTPIDKSESFSVTSYVEGDTTTYVAF